MESKSNLLIIYFSFQKVLMIFEILDFSHLFLKQNIKHTHSMQVYLES